MLIEKSATNNGFGVKWQQIPKGMPVALFDPEKSPCYHTPCGNSYPNVQTDAEH